LARLADSARAAAAVASCASVVPEWRVWLPGVHCWPNCAREAAPWPRRADGTGMGYGLEFGHKRPVR